METVASFEIRRVGMLGEDGVLAEGTPLALGDPEAVLEGYRLMVRTRAFDRRAVELQRTGRLGTYASSLGQEAIGAAIGLALRAEDILVPSYREHAAQIARGVTLTELLLFWGGDERGCDFALARHDFPVCVPIATQCTHAAGAACAVRYRGEARAVLAACGDGATSKGDFYEALNLAGVWTLPLVVVVSNNQWAISLPRGRQSAAATLAQKALAAGIDGLQVDGNDIVALRQVIGDALDRARGGAGPTLIEALTYRLADHTTADDASRYRSPEEVEAQRGRDPLIRTRAYLERAGVWDEGRQRALEAEVASELDAAVEAYLATPEPPPGAMFDHLFAELPAALAGQRAEVIGREGGSG